MDRSIHPRTTTTLLEAVREAWEMAMPTIPGSATEDPPPPIAVGITSPSQGAGKSTFAAALAGMLAEDFGADVALVDADHETRAIEQDLGLSGERGFTDYLRGTSAVEDVHYRVGRSTLTVVPVGTERAHVARTSRSALAAEFIRRLKETNRFVVVDLPPALPSSTTAVLARLCDAVIVVARVGDTTTVEIERTVQKLQGSEIRGVVLNRWRTRIPGWLESALALGR